MPKEVMKTAAKNLADRSVQGMDLPRLGKEDEPTLPGTT
jgi:hypothetical protein